LLAGLATTLSDWLGPAAVLVDLESHGREDLFVGIDVSRTVGWFTSIFPVRLDLSDAPLGARIRAIKEQLRGIPHNGVGYGLLRYLARDPARRARHAGLPEPQIGLNYLGQLDRIVSEDAFAVASETRGPDQSPLQVRRHLLDVNGAVFGGRLTMSWTYSSELHREQTVTDLANGYMDALRELIDHCRSHASESYTPSDFPDISLDQEELDRVLGEYER
jgi:non-ribosomal peptide synthase protein (TIGR01720 family)